MDITELILNDHHAQRRMFAFLDDIDRQNSEALRIGTSAGGKDSAASEVKDVLKGHHELRDATADVDRHDLGSGASWQAVIRPRTANSDHRAKEEREDPVDFRHHANHDLRHEIAVAFLAFESQHVAGIAARNRDPRDYVQQNS